MDSMLMITSQNTNDGSDFKKLQNWKKKLSRLLETRLADGVNILGAVSLQGGFHFHNFTRVQCNPEVVFTIISPIMIKLITRAEEEEVSAPLGSQLLSKFQKDKFTHFFYHVLDVNR